MAAPSRQQPRRAVRDNRDVSLSQARRSIKLHNSRSGIKKPKDQQGVKQSKKGGKYPFRARAKATKALERRVSAMETEAALLEQRELLGIVSEPEIVSPKTQYIATPKPAKPKRVRKRRQSVDMYMDYFLLSDEEGGEGEGGEGEGEGGEGEGEGGEGEGEGGKNKGIKGTDQLRRGDRWIPEMEHRRRPARKPESVPYQIWMAYSLMDDYIYRHSITDSEALTHPLMDDVYSFQNGGPQPVTPAGFQWNESRNLVPA
ncbi:hypothetical protein F5B19DRAFT_63337 [Rostrohypoxylon terebratum]|nr:hypothetical protein F5B19DRAFT_63337 [Rostrohypoxylon terebratum]